MDFIDHTVNWCKGEIFEGKMVVLAGAILLITGFSFWKFGTTPNAKAIWIPLVISAILFMVGAGVMIMNNQKRIPEYQKTFSENPEAFIASEKARAENFISWYPTTMYSIAGGLLVGIACYLFWAGPWGRAVGITVVILCLAVMVIDHFSEERAHTYYDAIKTFAPPEPEG